MNNAKTVSRPRTSLVASMVISLGVGAVGALISANSSQVLSSINTPPYQPPSWLFPIVWTALFILMGLSSWLTASSAASYDLRRDAWRVYLWQLAFNLLWSVIFFRMELFCAALVCLAILWGLILVMIFRFRACSRVAAVLQIPYLLWVTFAAVLNRAIAVLN